MTSLSSRVARRIVLGVVAMAAVACGPPAGSPTGSPATSGGAPAASPGAAPTGADATGAGVPAAPPAADRLRIGYPALSTSFLSTFVAADRGVYARHGLAVEAMHASAQVAITGLTTGDMDFTMSLGSAARAAAQGLPVRVVALSGRAPQLYVLAQPEYRGLADLRGKVLSPNSVSGSTGQTAILLLRKHGVGRDDIQLIPGGDAPRQMEMLRQRQIDAALLPPPFPFLARQEGFTLLASAPDELQFAFSGLSTSQETIARRGDVVRRVITAEIEALRYIQADREGTLRVMAERFPAEPEVVAQTYDLIVGSFSRDGSLPREGIETVLALDKEEGAIAEHIRYEDVVDDRPLRDVHRALGIAS
jgi:NitT/TauT family transport system substrate-binding protein